MTDDRAVTVLNKIDNRPDGFTDGGVLILDALMARVFYQRVSANGDNEQFGHDSHLAEITSTQ